MFSVYLFVYLFVCPFSEQWRKFHKISSITQIAYWKIWVNNKTINLENSVMWNLVACTRGHIYHLSIDAVCEVLHITPVINTVAVFWMFSISQSYLAEKVLKSQHTPPCGTFCKLIYRWSLWSSLHSHCYKETIYSISHITQDHQLFAPEWLLDILYKDYSCMFTPSLLRG